MTSDRTGGYMSPTLAKLYDHVYGDSQQPGAKFYLAEALASGSPVAELGCGTGRVLIPIAREGIDITGIDLSPEMLAVLREKLAREPESVQKRVTLVEADICSFDLDRKFSLAIIPFRSFQHIIEVKDQLSCLASVRRHLEPQGRLVFDLFYPMLDRIGGPPQVQESENFPWTKLDDGSEIRRTDRQPWKDRPNQVLGCQLIYYRRWPDGREERHVQAFPFRYFFRFEVEHLLARAGFRVIDLYADFERTPFGEKYPCEMIFVATPD